MNCNTSRKFRAVRAIATAPDADRVCQRAGSLRFSHYNEKRNRAHRTGPASHIGEQKKRLKEKRHRVHKLDQKSILHQCVLQL